MGSVLSKNDYGKKELSPEFLPTEEWGRKLTSLFSNIGIVDSNSFSRLCIKRGDTLELDIKQVTHHGDRVNYNIAVIYDEVWFADLNDWEIRDKIVDWRRGGLPVLCAVTQASDDYLRVEIGFYGNLNEVNIIHLLNENRRLYFWDKKRKTIGELVVTGHTGSTFSFCYLGKSYKYVSTELIQGKLFLSPEDVKRPQTLQML